MPAGRRVGALVENLDLAPTLLDLAGLPPLPDARGRSLASEWTGDGPAPERPSFAEARPTGLVSVTAERHRMVLHPASGRVVLFDLAADPGEDRNVYEGEPEVAGRLRAQLLAWLKIGDRYLDQDVAPEVRDALEGLGYVR